MIKKVIIYGASSLGRLARHYLADGLNMDVIGFVVDDKYKTDNDFDLLPVFSWSEVEDQFNKDEVLLFVAIGYRSMRLRAKAYENAKSKGFKLINIIANTSFIAKNVILGDNNFIMPGAVIEPGVRVGSNNVVWSNSTICHDTIVGDHNFVASNVTIGGEACIGNQNFMGFSSVILQNISIGNEVLIAAMSLVIKNTINLSHYHGAPAIKVKDINSAEGVCVESTSNSDEAENNQKW